MSGADVGGSATAGTSTTAGASATAGTSTTAGTGTGSTGAASGLVVLVGPPGCGAGEVAPLVASRLGAEVRDSDAEIERSTGRPAGDLLLDDGEEAFREAERAAVAAVLEPGRAVVALGSGAVLDAGARAALRAVAGAGGDVVLLDVSAEEAIRRAGLNQPRPLLLGNPRAQLRALLDERRPLYDEVATHAVATDGATAQEVADLVVAALGVRGDR